MHDFGVLIWILLLIIGMVSSIRRSAQRQRPGPPQALRPMAPPQMPPQAVRPLPPLPTPSQPVRMPQPVRIPRAAAPPPLAQPAQPAPAPVPPPIVAAPPLAPHQPAHVARSGSGAIRGMFEGSATLVRAIVASEVLGPPLALREHTTWSPRRSEPST
jgi:hypothetical protein